jgi:2'-5' RNA ligase
MRLFTAIELPDLVRRHLAEQIVPGLVADSLTSVAPRNLHVTLKFLGEVDESAVIRLCDGLGRVRVERMDPLRAGHAELLPPRGPVRVVTVGLDGDVGRVAQLHHAIEGACAEFVPAERRRFLPHITLARARDPMPHDWRASLHHALERHLPGPDFAAASFTLFESRLSRGPPAYVPLARFGG